MFWEWSFASSAVFAAATRHLTMKLVDFEGFKIGCSCGKENMEGGQFRGLDRSFGRTGSKRMLTERAVCSWVESRSEHFSVRRVRS